MAKKSRRPNIPEKTLERARRQMERGEIEPVSVTSVQPAGEAVAQPKPRVRLSSADLREEYAYVVSDLQSMGILAAAFLALLIVLSVII